MRTELQNSAYLEAHGTQQVLIAGLKSPHRMGVSYVRPLKALARPKSMGLSVKIMPSLAKPPLVLCTWTPKVCKIMAFRAVVETFCDYVTYVWGLASLGCIPDCPSIPGHTDDFTWPRGGSCPAPLAASGLVKGGPQAHWRRACGRRAWGSMLSKPF